jgi:hypothetical protein
MDGKCSTQSYFCDCLFINLFSSSSQYEYCEYLSKKNMNIVNENGLSHVLFSLYLYIYMPSLIYVVSAY